MRLRAVVGVTTLASVVTGVLARAEVTPVGPALEVTTEPPFHRAATAVAMDGAGNFVVVWQTAPGDGSEEGDGYGVFAKRFDASGASLGTPFRVNTYTPGPQFAPAVAADPQGHFTVSWASGTRFGLHPVSEDGSAAGAFLQRYDVDAKPVGPELQANTYTTDWQDEVSVAMDAAGNFVVVWRSTAYGYGQSQDGDRGGGIFGQRYDSTGARLGSEFQVNTYTTGPQESPVIAMDAAGSFVVVWASGFSDGSADGSRDGVFARRFDSTGAPLGDDFQVNTYTTSFQDRPVIAAAPDGSFVVVWASGDYNGATQDGSGFGVFGQRFDATGAPLGSEFAVNTYTTGDQSDPSVGVDAGGNFIVAWSSENNYRSGIFAKHFTAAGVPDGAEFQVNASTTLFGTLPAVAAGPEGTFVVTWEEVSEFDDSSARAQRFRALGPRRIIAGSKLRLDDDPDATLRRLLVRSADRGIVLGGGNGSDDDPTISGGHLRVRSATFDDTYELPAANWRTIKPPGANRGYVYEDPFLFAGPVAAVKIRAGERLRIWAKGSQLGHTLTTNPNPVTVTLETGEFGQRYCMTFGGVVRFRPRRRFRAHGAPAACP